MITKPLNYYGFAFAKPLDKAEKKHKKKLRKQLAKHGLDQSEVWALDVTLAKFILPRLKLLRKTHHGYPPNLTDSTWKETLKKMENSFQITIDGTLCEDNRLQYTLGLNLFAQYFPHLWD
jgi:hypothetical protein